MSFHESLRAAVRRPMRHGRVAAISLLLLSGCAAPSRVQVLSSAPPLPQEALQPPKPSWCQPSCSDALKTLLNSLTTAIERERRATKPTE